MIGHKGEQAVTVRALRGAAPYIHMYKGKVFVIKTGGGAFRDTSTMRAFVEQVAILHHLGIRVVLVHGGGPQLDEVTAQLGVATRMVQGRRVTDASAIDADEHGAERAHQHAAAGAVPRLRHRGNRPERRRRRAWCRRTGARRSRSRAARSWTTAWSATSMPSTPRC